MKYTRYISTAIKTNGVPNLSNEGFASLMNIVHLEGAKSSLEKIKERERNPALKHKYDIWIDDYQLKLDGLTEGVEPKMLMKKLVEG